MSISKLCLTLLAVCLVNKIHAADDYFGGQETLPITGNVSANDGNANETPLMVATPLYGSVQSSAGEGELGLDGSFTYTPNPGFSGVDVFVYQLGEELFEVRLFSGSVQLLSANNPDLALSVSSASNRTEAELLTRSNDLSSSWSFIDNNNTFELKTDLSSDRAFVLETWQPSAAGEQLTLYRQNQQLWQKFSIADNALGNHQIRSEYTNYTINRVAGTQIVAQPAVASSSDDWLLTGVNQLPPPSAVDDRFVIAVDEVLNGNVLNNDTANSIDFASFLISRPQHGEFIGINQSIYDGLAPFGAFTYQPDSGFEGEDHFTYMSLGSANGTPSTLTTVTIRVGNLNSPVANDDVFIGGVDQVISGRVLNNDENTGGGFFDPQAVLVLPPRYGSFIGINQSIYGGLAPFGAFDYQPGPNFNGVDSFAYKIINSGVDSAVATVYLVSGEVKLAPLSNWQLKLGTDALANRTPFVLIDEDQSPDQNFLLTPIPLTDRLLFNYANKALETWMPQAEGLEATLYSLNEQPWQQFNIQLAPSGAIVIQSAYTGSALQPEQVALGENIITQAITGDVSQQWLMAGPNQPFAPSAANDTFETTVDTQVEGNVLNNDEVNGYDFFSLPVTQPSNGQLVGLGGAIYDGITPWGVFTYQPNPGFVGQDRFVYQAFTSGNGAPSRFVTVTINVSD